MIKPDLRSFFSRQTGRGERLPGKNLLRSLTSLSPMQVPVPASPNPVKVGIEGVQGPKVMGMIGVDDVTVFSSSQCPGEFSQDIKVSSPHLAR
ncbi:hypothetical protein E2C01_015178 [Portunus trituberculatus]|uniref:Uncharacterized protein n=1 Tax=Portunus trituberculatus TaxID=210409 RepID=A0A5B7DKM5_PORTR|nr:hypothetical protein [Portunus trituberculatus]